ncbi:glutamine--fructose-6-phosphate transaminase (isomerizing) [Candidatus Woesebacteria bacterium]|nr:glutamine--fructose-6-phosphate transaminase (isomerizing) [Candidatus Woesebacteria bacterium]
MCGIYGYKGVKTNAGSIVINGLKRLDYRGYDSWGVAVCADNALFVEKEVGKISDIRSLEKLPNGNCAIAHTRWATTGAVNTTNAHPHYSTDKSFVLAQNGIVENFDELKKMLVEKNYRFASETDTEVIVRLIEEKQKTQKSLLEAIRAAFLQLDGRNTIIALTKEGEIYAARNGSPLVVGKDTKTNDIFVSSDVLSFAPYVDTMAVVENNQMIQIGKGGDVSLFDVKDGTKKTFVFEPMTIKADTIQKEGHDHFMVKEIFETPQAIRKLLSQPKGTYEELANATKRAPHVYTIGSGTAGFAASQIAFYLRVFGGIRATNLVGADARSYYGLFQKDDLIIAPSQSGETADVMEVLEYAKNKKMKIASVVNMPGSMMTRMSDYPFMSEAGPEICVMSTKVFSSQIAWGYLVAKTLQEQYENGHKHLEFLAYALHTYLEQNQNIARVKMLAKHLARKQHIFLLGKYQNLAVVNEGMVKIVEGAYHHAHAIPAGDLKHYAITLMEEGVPVIAVVSDDVVKNDMNTAINEVRLRGAEVIAIGHKKQENYDYFLPVPDTGETDAIGNVVPLQLLAYFMAVELGNNVDKPRNIAKSVTVK